MALYFGSITGDLIALFAISSAFVYFYAKYAFNYWQRCGIKSFSPSFPFGNFGPAFMQKTAFHGVIGNLYNKSTERFFGTYATIRPMLVLRDPEIIRSVMIKDFQYFTDRGLYINEERDPLSGHLFSMTGEKWKNLRNKLTPVFTSGKLKAMFSTLVDCGAPLDNLLKRAAENKETVEFREIAARYSTNVIASVAFGVDINTIDNPDHPFRAAGRKAFDLNFMNGFRLLLQFLSPPLMEILKMKTIDSSVESFIMNLVKKNVEYREENDVTRKDFFQLMIQLRNSGKIQMDGDWDTQIKDKNNKFLSINEIAAQTWVFYAAGFETSSSAMSFCLYELARNPDIQEKVQMEIDEITKKHNGEITYTSVNEMKYLEACIDETLRKYPSVPMLNRVCIKDYKIPDSNVTIEKGTSVIIPLYAIQQDAKYYPEPTKFDPSRFLAENTADKSFVDMPYMPFGEGPRNCIGLRLGKLQTKVGLISMIQKYKLSLEKAATGELVFSPKTILLSPIGGINLKVAKR